MGYFNKLEQDVMSMAHDMGDDFGEDAKTILVISRALDVSPEEVQRVLEGDLCVNDIALFPVRTAIPRNTKRSDKWDTSTN